MLQCSSCGSNLRPTARICIKCGYAVTDEERKQALQQDAATSASTSVSPIYKTNPAHQELAGDPHQPEGNKGPVFSSPVGEIASPSDDNKGPVFSSPVGEIATPVVRSQDKTVETLSTPLALNGLGGHQKKIAAITVSIILVIGFVYGLTSIVSNKEADPSTAPTSKTLAPAVPAAPATEVPSEKKTSSVIDFNNIRPVMAPPQTSGLLTDMLINNSNSVQLLELKAKIEQIYPKPERGDRKTARALNDEALIAFRQGNYQQAANLFSEALKNDPSDIEVLNNFAFALLKDGRYVDAERVLGFVLSIAPGRTSAWANLADVYANTSKPDSASAAFVVGFRFATNQDKSLAYLKDRADTESNEYIRRAVINALAQLSQ
jgi:tetratricopeptide (TPR) repeat protein